MKRKFWICSIVVILLASMWKVPVQAGSSEIVIDASSYEKELNGTIWNNLDGDIYVDDGELIFPENSTDLTALVTKVMAKDTGWKNVIVSAEATIEFIALPKGETFAMALGLGSVESVLGDVGNIEIGFSNNDGIETRVTVYDQNGDENVLMQSEKCGSIGGKVKVKAVITSENFLKLSLNGKEVCNGKLAVKGEGRVGFLQSGSCSTKVSDVYIVSYQYDRPENANVLEDFEQGGLNTNVLSSKMVSRSWNYFPSGCDVIEQEDGNHVLQFNNTGCIYLGTKYQYSNFELTLDILNLQRKNVLDNTGKVILPRCDSFGISIGGDSADYNDAGYTNAADLILFSASNEIRSYHTGTVANAEEKGYPIFSEDCEKDFSIKISVVDAVINVGLKWVDEEAYKDILTYRINDETPMGYIHLWTTSTVNMALDNFCIINKDENPTLTEVDFLSGNYEIPEDYTFERLERIYAEQEDGVEPYWLILPVAVICIVTLAVTGVVVHGRTRKEDQHEV